MPQDDRIARREVGEGQGCRTTSANSVYEHFLTGATAYSMLESDYRRKAQHNMLQRFAAGKSDAVLNSIAGGVAGAVSGFVTCPLDVIKTKLQAQGGFRAVQTVPKPPGTSVLYNGLLGTSKVIWHEEGIRGMYRGLGPIILGYLPTWATWFVVYGKSKEFFRQHSDNDNVINFFSSLVAGGCSTMVTNPIWVIKTRMMSQVSRRSKADVARPPWHYTSTWDAARKMYMTEGFLSFYSGLTPALLGLTHVAVQFPAYEYLKKRFTGGPGLGEHGDGPARYHGWSIVAASFLSKVMASMATYPHEVIRTRLQTQQRSMNGVSDTNPKTITGGVQQQHVPQATQITMGAVQRSGPRYRGLINTFQTILKEEGWRAFYAGMGTNLMRAIPAAMTTMLTYEFVIQQLHNAKVEGEAG